MTKRTPVQQTQKAAMKKIAKKASKKAVAASKPAKKAVPAKKPAPKTVVKTKAAVEAKVVDKKAVAASDKSKTPPPKKAAPAPVAKKEEPKKSLAPVAAKAAPKKDDDKAARSSASPAKKTDAARPGAVTQARPVSQPIKVEPKIIESPQQEFVSRVPDEQLFNAGETERFRELLHTERNKILTKARKAMEEGNIAIDKDDMFDEVDQASAMIEQNLTFRLLDRDRKLLSEIEHAILKLETGDFGYCEGTGEPIPKRRLELRPWCRHSVKYKEKLERMKKSGRGVVDEDGV